MSPNAEVSANLGEKQSIWPDVTIIVLNWNNYEDTAKCLKSLKHIGYPNYEVVMVDNGSTDGSGKRLQEEFTWCDFLFNGENLGFAAGNNVGIEYALDSDQDYVLLLNNDITASRDFLTPLVETSEKDTDVAIVGGIINEMSSGQIWFAGGTFSRGLCRGSHKQEVTSDEPYETEFVTGAMMLLDVDFLEKTGGLNEDYFFGMEDVDLSLTAKKLGWTLLVAPNATVTHNVSSSAGRRSPFKYYHATRNRLQLSNSHLRFRRQLLFYILFSLSRIVRVIQWGFSGRFDLIRSVYQGTRDHRAGESFKRPEAFDN